MSHREWRAGWTRALTALTSGNLAPAGAVTPAGLRRIPSRSEDGQAARRWGCKKGLLMLGCRAAPRWGLCSGAGGGGLPPVWAACGSRDVLELLGAEGRVATPEGLHAFEGVYSHACETKVFGADLGVDMDTGTGDAAVRLNGADEDLFISAVYAPVYAAQKVAAFEEVMASYQTFRGKGWSLSAVT
jgi:hypothetical protein